LPYPMPIMLLISQSSIMCPFVLSCSLHCYITSGRWFSKDYCSAEYLSNVHGKIFADESSAPLPAAASKLTEAGAANGTTRAAETDYVGRRMAMLVRNGTRRRGDATLGAEAVAPAADGDAQPDTAALASCFKHRGRGNSVFPDPFQTALISRSSGRPCRTEQTPRSSRILTLQLQMPGVRSESPSPEVRRIRMALPTTSSKVASARSKLAERAKTPANSTG
jgi:hypothetical protein